MIVDGPNKAIKRYGQFYSRYKTASSKQGRILHCILRDIKLPEFKDESGEKNAKLMDPVPECDNLELYGDRILVRRLYRKQKTKSGIIHSVLTTAASDDSTKIGVKDADPLLNRVVIVNMSPLVFTEVFKENLMLGDIVDVVPGINWGRSWRNLFPDKATLSEMDKNFFLISSGAIEALYARTTKFVEGEGE